MPTIAEDLLLIALDDQSGRFLPSQNLELALFGAVIVELIQHGHLQLDGDRVRVVDKNPPDDDFLAWALTEMQGAWIDRSPSGWIVKWALTAGKKGVGQRLREHLLDSLVEQGAIRRNEKRKFRFFERVAYPAASTAREDSVRALLRGIVLDGRDADVRSAVLLSLLRSCKLIEEVFRPEELERHGDNIDRATGRVSIDRYIQRALDDMAAVGGDLSVLMSAGGHG